MRFGLDSAQQRVSRDESVHRVRLGEDLGSDGTRGFDHYLVRGWPKSGDLQVEAFVRDVTPEFA
jgi:hypothetical protein